MKEVEKMLRWNNSTTPAPAPSVSVRTWMIAITAFVVIAVMAAVVLLSPVATLPIMPMTPVTPATETPTAPVEPPASPVTPVAPVAPPVPPVPAPEILANFIVSDDLWQYAFPLNKAGGGPFHRAVGFSEVPVGTKLHAPMDGRVHFFWMGEGTPEENHMVILAKPGWDTEENRNVRSMQFSAKGIEVLNWEPKEGEPFAIIKDVGELFPGFYDRAASLMIGVDPWAETLSDRSIADSRVYIRKAIEKQN